MNSLRLPCLGICRGLQFMNVHNGGTLHAHLPDVLGTNAHRAGTEGNSRDTLHTVIAGSNAEFIGIETETTSEVISHHHQGINQLGTGLEAWVYASDGLIEGIRRKRPCGISFLCRSPMASRALAQESAFGRAYWAAFHGGVTAAFTSPTFADS